MTSIIDYFANIVDFSALTENGALAYSLDEEPVLKQLWIMVDEHISEHISVYERYKRTVNAHREFLNKLHDEVLSYIKAKNIHWLNSIFTLIVRKRDYRNGGEGHKMLYPVLLFNFFDALCKSEDPKAADIYMYTASKLSNQYGCWKDLRTMYILLSNPDKIQDALLTDKSVDFSKIQFFKTYLVDAFVEQLKVDIDNFNNGRPITLCSKFAPTQNNDKAFARRIARKLFKTPTSDKDYRQILTKMHAYSHVIEQYVCGKKLDEFNPEHITGCNKQFYKKQFNHPTGNWKKLIGKFNKMTKDKLEEVKRINDRLEEIIQKIFILQAREILSEDEKAELEKLKKEEETLKQTLKKMKIATGADSADIIKLMNSISVSVQNGTTDATSALMIEAIRAKLDAITKLDVLCVCDTSGSMTWYDQAINAALMLTYLTSSTLSNPKFRNKFITFSRDPKWLSVPGGKIEDFWNTIASNSCCQNTDIQKTIDLITSSIKGTTFNPKAILFLTDGQFDEMANYRGPISCKDYIKQKFAEIGREPPLCIFWNLRNCNAVEARAGDNGFVMYSGFSQKQLDSLATGIFELEAEGKEVAKLSTEDLIIQFLHSSFKNKIFEIMHTYTGTNTINGVKVF